MITKDSIARFCHIEHHIIVAIEELLYVFPFAYEVRSFSVDVFQIQFVHSLSNLMAAGFFRLNLPAFFCELVLGKRYSPQSIPSFCAWLL